MSVDRQTDIVRRENKCAVFLSQLEIMYGPLSVEHIIYCLILEMKHARTFYNVNILNITFFKKSFPMQ